MCVAMEKMAFEYEEHQVVLLEELKAMFDDRLLIDVYICVGDTQVCFIFILPIPVPPVSCMRAFVLQTTPNVKIYDLGGFLQLVLIVCPSM